MSKVKPIDIIKALRGKVSSISGFCFQTNNVTSFRGSRSRERVPSDAKAYSRGYGLCGAEGRAHHHYYQVMGGLDCIKRKINRRQEKN